MREPFHQPTEPRDLLRNTNFYSEKLQKITCQYSSVRGYYLDTSMPNLRLVSRPSPLLFVKKQRDIFSNSGFLVRSLTQQKLYWQRCCQDPP